MSDVKLVFKINDVEIGCLESSLETFDSSFHILPTTVVNAIALHMYNYNSLPEVQVIPFIGAGISSSHCID